MKRERFTSSPYFKHYSPRNKANPNRIHIDSKSSYWFRCNCGHEVMTTPDKFRGECKFCFRVCNTRGCRICVKKYIHSIPRIGESLLNYEMIPKNCKKICNFRCTNCSALTSSTAVEAIVYGVCIACKNAALCKDDKCKICYNPFLSTRKPTAISETFVYVSGYNHMFKCPGGHLYYDNIYNLSGCPRCVHCIMK